MLLVNVRQAEITVTLTWEDLVVLSTLVEAAQNYAPISYQRTGEILALLQAWRLLAMQDALDLAEIKKKKTIKPKSLGGWQ